MIKIVADDKIPFLRGALDDQALTIYAPGASIDAKMVSNADAIITRTRTKCDAALLADSTVRFIASATIGYDHIDTAYCESRGVQWTNAPGCNSSSVAQYVTAAALSLSNRFGFDLKRKTLGVIGVGNVGSKVAKVGEALGARVLLNDPPRARREVNNKAFVSLDEVLEESDIITLHVPLTLDGLDQTYHMVDARFLERMKYGSFLINSSRGPVVRAEALKRALTKGKLMGAVLDVWENEPTPDLELMELVNIATPHIAGYSLDGKAKGTCMSVQAISRFFNLGADDWFPKDIPSPPNPVVAIDGSGKTELEILREAVTLSYDIEAEDARLRESPETFEKQRADYPFRREFPAYALETRNCPATTTETLTQLGFHIRDCERTG